MCELKLCFSNFSDLQHYEMCERLVILMECALLENKTLKNCTAEKKIRAALCAILQFWLDAIQNLHSDVGPSVSAAPSSEAMSGKLWHFDEALEISGFF